MTTEIEDDGRLTQVTETLMPHEPLGRHKTRGFNTRGVVEAFLELSQPTAYGSNIFCDRGVLYSFGYHFQIARWVQNTADCVPVLLVRDKGGMTTTTATKHRGPLMRALAKADVKYYFLVPEVTGDSLYVHRINYRHKLAHATAQAEKCLTGPKDHRPHKAWYAIDCLFVAFHYGRRVMSLNLPDAEMPYGVLRDWLEEFLPDQTALINAAHMLDTEAPADGPGPGDPKYVQFIGGNIK